MSLKPSTVVSPGLPPPPDGVAGFGDPLLHDGNYVDARQALRNAGIWWEAFGRCSRFVRRMRNQWTGQAGVELRLAKDCPRKHAQAIESWNSIGPLMKRDWIARHDGPPIAARIFPLHMPEADSIRLWAVAVADDGCRRLRYSGRLKWHSPLTEIVDFHPDKTLADLMPMLAAEHGWDAKALEIEPVEQLYVPTWAREDALNAPADAPSAASPSPSF